jgi:hypothetical protein
MNPHCGWESLLFLGVFAVYRRFLVNFVGVGANPKRGHLEEKHLPQKKQVLFAINYMDKPSMSYLPQSLLDTSFLCRETHFQLLFLLLSK